MSGSSEAAARSERFVAGVALEPWADEMTLGDHPVFGTATLRRAESAPSLAGAELVLSVEGPARQRLLRSAGEDAATRVHFAMTRWMRADASLSYGKPPAGADGWYELITRHGLLSHPEWLWQNRLGGADVPGGEAGAALSALRKQFEQAVARDEWSRSYGPTCRECAEAARRRILEAQARAPGRAPWELPAIPRADCPHRALAAAALRAICERWPAVAFELVEWLVPVEGLQMAGGRGFFVGDAYFDTPSGGFAAAAAAHRGSGERPPGAGGAKRYVLAPDVARTALRTWLLGESAELRYQRSWYGRSERRWTFRPPRGLDGGEGLSREQRAAIMLAGATWGMGSDVDALGPGAASAGEAVALDAEAAPPVPGVYALAESEPADSGAARKVRGAADGRRDAGAKKGGATKKGGASPSPRRPRGVR